MDSATLPAPPSQTLTGQGRLGACIGAVALVSLLAFEAMAVAAAMPAVAAALDGVALYALAFGGLLAASILGMALAGRWCDRGGLWRSTATGLATFAAGLAVAGCADYMGWFVAGRVAQGLGGGMLEVALYVGMGQLVPAALHPRLFALFSAAWVLPGLVGPMVAAGLVGHFGWRAVFLLAAAATPVAAMLLLPAFGRLPLLERRDDAAARGSAGLRWAALAAVGALSMQGAGVAGSVGRTLAMAAAGLALSLLAAWRLFPAGTLRARPGLPAVIALRGLLGAAFAAAEAFIPLHLTHALGWSLGRASVALSVGAVLWSCGSAAQSRVVQARHRRRLLRAGFLAVALGIALAAAALVRAWPAWIFLAGWAAAGGGIGVASPMLSVLTLGLSAPAERGRHSAALQLNIALCSSAALALAGGLSALPGAHGFVAVMALASGLAGVGAACAGRVAGAGDGA